MQTHRARRTIIGVTSLVAALSAGVLAGAQGSGEPAVTPITGPSWLTRLGIPPYGDTSLGRGAPTYGPPAETPSSPAAPRALPIDQRIEVTGEDLYRYSCQTCHGPRGAGRPPEIKSILPLVGLGAKARGDVYKRIHTGGQRMPSREQLTDADVAVLYGYLNVLAGHQPTTTTMPTRPVSWPRLGELVVKGTCHICHDAAGPRPSGRARLDGAIPAMNVVLADKSIVDFVDKVRHGATVAMGDVPYHYRGRMPVFAYLKEQEVAAAYLYLTMYPPRASNAASAAKK